MAATFFESDPDLQTRLESGLQAAWETFSGLARNQIAATWLVYDPPFPINTGGGD